MITRRNALAGGLALAGLPIIGKTSPVKSMLGANNTSLESDTSSAPTARDYIQDGLIAMWDGIENAGWGKHDPNATTWKDLTGSGQDCYQNGSVALPLIGENYIGFDSTARSFVFDFADAVKPTKFIGVTLEIVGAFPGVGTNTNFFSASPFNGYKGNFVSRYAASQLTISSYTTQLLTGIALPSVGFAVITSASGFSVYRKGAFVSSHTCSFSGNSNLSKGYFGLAVRSQIENPRNAKIYGCRIYSRALTADEIAYNYSIDKTRFNLP